MVFNARRTLATDHQSGIPVQLPYLVEHVSGHIAATAYTWREALMLRDALEEKEQAHEPA